MDPSPTAAKVSSYALTCGKETHLHSAASYPAIKLTMSCTERRRGQLVWRASSGRAVHLSRRVPHSRCLSSLYQETTAGDPPYCTHTSLQTSLASHMRGEGLVVLYNTYYYHLHFEYELDYLSTPSISDV